MTGQWLIRAGRAILHDDTFELMVAPAIADLQINATAAAYAAAWTSLIAAAADDFFGDLRIVAEDIGLLTVLIVIQAGYYASMLLLLVAHMSAGEAIQTVTGKSPQVDAGLAPLLAMSALPTLLCFWPARRAHSLES